MTFKLPTLNYSKSSLSPIMSEDTLDLHHGKHHQTYITNLNNFIKDTDMSKMTLEEIQELIKFVAKSGATEVDLEFEGVKISIKSPAKKRRGKPDDPIEIVQQETSMQTVAAPVITETLKTAIPTETVTQSTVEDDSKYITIKASMIGTFYSNIK